MLETAPFELEVLPSAMMDIVRTQYFYDSLERGLGLVFRDYIVGEIDKLMDNAGIESAKYGAAIGGGVSVCQNLAAMAVCLAAAHLTDISARGAPETKVLRHPAH